MVVEQKVKEAEITEQDSLLLTRNLLRIAILNISYIRGLFPEKYFNDKSVPALEMKIKKLMPMDAESRRLIDWMEKGVYDALQKKYLKTLLFCVCEAIEGPMIEEYAFCFSYSNSESQEVSMNINRMGNKKERATFKSNTTTDITPNQMRSSACKMVRTLVQLMRTLNRMPEARTILMKLFYYEDITPVDYEPPIFRCKHFLLALKVKSVLDPCEDENVQDDDVSLGADSAQMDDTSDSGSEVNHSPGEDRYVIAPRGKQQSSEVDVMADEDDTQDDEEDKNQFNRVKDRMESRHIDTVELTDVLAFFPDISVVLTEDIMDKLVNEWILSRAGRDIYTISKHKKLDLDINEVKEVMDIQENPVGEDQIYMKALYHALPMDYVTVAKLRTKLEGEANQTTVHKLMCSSSMFLRPNMVSGGSTTGHGSTSTAAAAGTGSRKPRSFLTTHSHGLRNPPGNMPQLQPPPQPPQPPQQQQQQWAGIALKLSLQDWRGIRYRSGHGTQNTPAFLSIHGLWANPENPANGFVPFDRGMVTSDPNLYHRARINWPCRRVDSRILQLERNFILWAHEWKTHGKDCNMTQTEWMKYALDWYESLDYHLHTSINSCRDLKGRLNLPAFLAKFNGNLAPPSIHTWVRSYRTRYGMLRRKQVLTEVIFYREFNSPRLNVAPVGSSKYTASIPIYVL